MPPEGAHCSEFLLVSPGLAGDVVEVSVDTDTDASDHQPLELVLPV